MHVAEIIAFVILAHLVGDYLLQSHWMATQKTERWWPAIVHGLVYTLPFLLITLNPFALVIIAWTHVLIDHWRLAKHVGWLKNKLGPKRFRVSYEDAMANGGYARDVPVWLSTWLMIITDNTLHILIAVVAILVFH